jgi:16S rRNA (uracil1498-N3)-methyltransferase
MHRFYLPPEHTKGDVLLLKDREAHHGAQVLRLKAGDTVEVLDGAGTQLTCEVMRVTRTEMSLTVQQRSVVARRPFDITLLQAIIKGKAMETIIQKGTELGLTRIVPIQTERVVSQLDDEGAQSKQAKWQLIAIEAIKQCGSAWLPRIDTPIAPGAFLKCGEKFDLSLVGSLEGDGRHARQWFQSLSAAPRHVAVWIGPEGDFTPVELELIRASGAKPITLGDLVLRADTAAIYSLAVIRHELEGFTATGSAL